jgi:hypothetical protein
MVIVSSQFGPPFTMCYHDFKVIFDLLRLKKEHVIFSVYEWNTYDYHKSSKYQHEKERLENATSTVL